MHLQEEVTRQLNAIHRQRNRVAYLTVLVLALASTYLQREKLLTDHDWLYALILISGGIFLRFVTFEFFFKGWSEGELIPRVMNYGALVIQAIGWSYHFFIIYHHYGPESGHTYSTLLIIAALIIGGVTSLGAHKNSCIIYLTVMCLGPLVTYMHGATEHDLYVLFFIAVFFMFNLAHFKFSYNQLKTSVETQLQSQYEKDRLKRLINAVPGFVYIFDENLVYVEANALAVKNFPEILGKKVDDKKNSQEFVSFIENFMQSEKEFDVREINLNLSDLNWFLMSIQRTEDKGAILVAIPMDELMKARQELRSQEAKAQYAAKLASLGEMAAGIAHEVNNPLTIIQGTSLIVQRMVMKEPIDKEGIIHLTNKMVDTTERISKIISSLKSLSRNGETDPFEPISLNKMTTQCLDICRQRCHNFEIELRLPLMGQDIVFKGREVQLGQVLVNLLSNAIDAVKAQNEKWVELRFETSSQFLDILVLDSGPGVPPEIRSKIMEPFFTTKEINQGTGLGLSISKSIMQIHGGELTLVTEEKHTTFRMRLPYIVRS